MSEKVGATWKVTNTSEIEMMRIILHSSVVVTDTENPVIRIHTEIIEPTPLMGTVGDRRRPHMPAIHYFQHLEPYDANHPCTKTYHQVYEV